MEDARNFILIDEFLEIKKSRTIIVRLLVGVAGFEPATSCSQSRRDNRATLHPEIGCKYKQIFYLNNV